VTEVPDFIAWWQRWEDLWVYKGVHLPDCDTRIAEILKLSQSPVPGSWKRNEDRKRLRAFRYTRSDKGRPNPGEHRIEHEILCGYFDKAVVLGAKLIDGVNALPLVKNPGNKRLGNTEADLLLLTEKPCGYQILVGEVKAKNGNAWSALVENLRQLRLLLEADFVQGLFQRRNPGLKTLVPPWSVVGIVVAPREWYVARGQKAQSVTYARRLVHAVRQTGACDLRLTVWDRESRSIDELE
jgi:hypothetical protein